MKTVTGQTVRFPLAAYGTRVNSLPAAVTAVGFNLLKEPISRARDGAEIPGTVGLFRSDDGGCVGIHGAGFTFLQPHETLETLERARQQIGGDWCSVAVLKGGRGLSASVSLQTEVVAPKRGDKLGLSVLLLDSFDGSKRCQFKLVANVLACNNGMVTRESLFTFAEKHTSSLRDRAIAMEGRLLESLRVQVQEMQETVTALDSREMSREEVVGFANRLFPAADERAVPTRVQNNRDAVVTGFFRGAGNVGRTRWDAFNAVTEHLDWNGTFRETEHSREDNRFESILSGSAAGVRSRALELLLN